MRVYVRSQKNEQEAHGQFILIEPTGLSLAHAVCWWITFRSFSLRSVHDRASSQGGGPLFVSLNNNVSPVSPVYA